MKNIKYILFLLVFQTLTAQNIENDWNTVYKKPLTEKVYLQLNNVLYEPGEVIYFKGFVTESDNSPTTLSDYVYIDLFDGSNKKIASQIYLVENGSISCSYKIPENTAAGLYKIRAYTQIQNQTEENVFEKTVFVQKVVTPRILMTLDFKKKSYGKGEFCEADFELKNLESQPIKYQTFKYDVFIAGKKIDSLEGKTNELGKAVVNFKLPENLKSTDGIVNVMLDYDNFKESVTRAIPINLNFVDLQFLPESGNFILNEASSLFFIAKNEFGFPMDVTGFIEDEKGIKIADFKSIHDGMGNVILKTEEHKKYFAVLTSSFKSDEKIELPAAEKNVFAINAKKRDESVVLNIYAPLAIDAKILVRNTTKINKSVNENLKQGWNTVTIQTKDLPVGIQSFSLVVDDRVAAERLVFLNYQDGLKIDIKTDKEIYLRREKVKVSIVTKDKNNNTIASSLSVSVVDSKLLTYIDDKQDNILSWLFLGAELKGKIYEPRFYFDNNKKLEEKEAAIDVLLNTHGWRKYSQKNIQKLLSERKILEPEKSDVIEGFVLNDKEKPAAVKVIFFTDQGRVYETKSNSSGYFKFNRVVFSDLAYLVAEHKSKRQFTIKNSISNTQEFLSMKDTLSNTSLSEVSYKIVKTTSINEISDQPASNTISLKGDSNNLDEVLVVGYGSISRKKELTGSVVIVTANEITSSLSGRVAGIQISSGSGQPGTTDKVVIRGLQSIYGSRSGGQPLIVIDGIPYANNENSSVFGNLSPSSINSIMILKDASAIALYGASAAYGVIVVTTKNKLMVGKMILGKKYNYTFQDINKSGTKILNEAEYFYVPKYTSTIVEEKTDFRSCIYWNSIIQTNNKGEANFEFFNSDDNTSFKILAEGTSYKGDIGKAEAVYAVKELIQTDIKVPVYTSQEDVISMPLWLKNNSEKSLKLKYKIAFDGKQNNDLKDSIVELNPNESKTVYISLIPSKIGKNIPLEIALEGENFKTKIKKTIDVYGKGFPKSVDISGTMTQEKDFTISDPIISSIDAGLELFYNPFSSIFDGLESMIREPYGCFEQVSSSNYPNIMAMQLLKHKSTTPEFKEKALKFLQSGYTKLKNYESKDGGFEWYGGNPGSEALTAYGLLQFNEMKEFIIVDKKLIERSMIWLNSRKDNKGGFKQNPAKYGFSGVKYEVNNAYIVYVLSEIGEIDMNLEYQKGLAEAIKSKDLYRMELMALASFNLEKIQEYKKLMTLIQEEINKQGLANLKAQQSVINSYGKSMSVEIASLYALALLKEKQITKEVLDAFNYIQSSKTLYGFGSTQATALALKAITEFNKIYAVEGTNAVATASLAKNPIDLTHKDLNGNVILENLKVDAGKNNFSIQIPDNKMIPYLFYVKYNTYTPDNSKDCKLILKTKSLTNKLKISETARLEVEVQNSSAEQVSNPIVRIGIPGGLTPEPWQLKLLVDKNNIDYYEIFGSELVFYFRKLNAKETRKINIDLKAIIPGNYKGIASSAYLYYENEHKNWNKGIEIEVIP
ncbi:TonB-dependent receptor plug domain-containing protein [Flavobacterium sp. MC2016-06]|uniref:TonB-dependent receptor plug domain-containing protein n=1 Tax=Flavobacterium sp. MC2016-06 TaxID=2676308 RepID=UPI0012BADF59|nr:TonB-dependent receptor plug domain-containing protein [Flavobacterium sp. MC2016-06]MBU3860710.1 TonB-dependent receptor plug domain-containing protein [Flavobacterium sp. MC2016-06]